MAATFGDLAVSVDEQDPRIDVLALDLVDGAGAVVEGQQVAVKNDQLGKLHAAAALSQRTLQRHRLALVPFHRHLLGSKF